jgi:predicted secreted protein
MPAGAPGTAATFKVDNAAGVLTAITTESKDVKMTRGVDTVDTTTLGDSSKEFLATLKGAQFQANGVWDATIDALLDGAQTSGTTRSFEYTPVVAGPVYTGECICTSYEISTAHDGAVMWSATFTVTGPVTRT